MNESLRRCWAEIDPAALRHNLAALREWTPEASAVAAVVKADAYGHGLETVVRTLAGQVTCFAVATVGEALDVRRYDPQARVLILGPALPEEAQAIVEHRFIPSLSSLEEARAYDALAATHAGDGFGPLRVHLVIDTGMGRIGIWKSGALATVEGIAALPHLALKGVSTHLPVADEDEEWTLSQLEQWRTLVRTLREATGLPLPVTHSLNSAGILRFGRGGQEGDGNGSLVRPGLMLYGCSPLPDYQSRLRPVLSWKTRITLLRDVPQGRGISYGRTFITPSPMRIATLGVGYGDGYPRHLSNRGAEVLVGGRRCPLLGRVTMDQVMVDVSKVPEVKPGDEAVLIGQQGQETILAAHLAEKAGTIPWEIFTGIGRRVVRVPVEA